jgi:hypothetical protein
MLAVLQPPLEATAAHVVRSATLTGTGAESVTPRCMEILGLSQSGPWVDRTAPSLAIRSRSPSNTSGSSARQLRDANYRAFAHPHGMRWGEQRNTPGFHCVA